jgi:hypothetical protein
MRLIQKKILFGDFYHLIAISKDKKNRNARNKKIEFIGESNTIHTIEYILYSESHRKNRKIYLCFCENGLPNNFAVISKKMEREYTEIYSINGEILFHIGNPF